MNETPLTITGNLVADPELKFTPSGHPVATFRVASTTRVHDKQTSEWRDGDTLYLQCVAWREMAENIAESLLRGMRVIVTGRLKQRSYEATDGTKRTVYELQVDDAGPSLRNASAKVTKAARGGQDSQRGSGQGSGRGNGQGSRAEDQWQADGGGSYPDEPPF